PPPLQPLLTCPLPPGRGIKTIVSHYETLGKLNVGRGKKGGASKSDYQEIRTLPDRTVFVEAALRGCPPSGHPHRGAPTQGLRVAKPTSKLSIDQAECGGRCPPYGFA